MAYPGYAKVFKILTFTIKLCQISDIFKKIIKFVLQFRDLIFWDFQQKIKIVRFLRKFIDLDHCFQLWDFYEIFQISIFGFNFEICKKFFNCHGRIRYFTTLWYLVTPGTCYMFFSIYILCILVILYSSVHRRMCPGYGFFPSQPGDNSPPSASRASPFKTAQKVAALAAQTAARFTIWPVRGSNPGGLRWNHDQLRFRLRCARGRPVGRRRLVVPPTDRAEKTAKNFEKICQRSRLAGPAK